MNKVLPAFFSLMGITFFLSCRSKDAYPTERSGKSLVWEITGKGLRKPSYFFGTMHMMCATDAELTPTVRSLIKDVDQVYLEVDLDNAAELLGGLINMQNKKGNTLAATLPAADYDKVKTFFETYQPSVPFSALEQQPPLMISSTIYELLLPCEQKTGVEMKIIDEAYKEKKQTKGLETIAFQSSIFDQIPFEEQAKDLVKSIDSLEKNRKAFNEMIAVYKNQDIEKLYTLSANEDSSTSKYMDLLLFNRNRNWVHQFPAIAKDSITLFAVGAGHLGGAQGVLQLLRNEGYIVRPLVN